MPGLKANTQGASPNANAAKPALPSGTAKAGPPNHVGTLTAAASSHARPRLPLPIPPIVTQQQSPPHPTKKQQPKKGARSTADVDPPPVSPITPPLMPAVPLKSTTPIPPPTIPPNFASMDGRAPLTNVSHPATVPAAPAPPVTAAPIDFDENPDVIALQATIGILLQQKKRAEEDIRRLREAKAAAMAQPMEFLKDLASGNVKQPAAGAAPTTLQKENEEEEEDDDDEDESQDGAQKNRGGASKASNTVTPKGKGKAVASPAAAASFDFTPAPAPKPWTNLPVPQSIARMPPINWAKYAVQGEALDRLHHEQQTAPTRGAPAVFGATGTYEFTATASITSNPDDGKKVDGVFAPFDVFKDHISADNTDSTKKTTTTTSLLSSSSSPPAKTGGNPSRRGGA